MANTFIDTNLLASRAFITDKKNEKFMNRPVLTNIVEPFVKDRDFTLLELAGLKSSTTRATEVMFFNKTTLTSFSEKSCNPVGDTLGTSKESLTWLKITRAVKGSWKQHAGNEVSISKALAMALQAADEQILQALDSSLLAFLDVNKSALNLGTSGTFNAPNSIMFVANADADNFYNLVASDMFQNNYQPNFNDVHSAAWMANMRRYANQGGSNATNLAFQFPGFDFFASNLITPGTIASNVCKSIHYIVPDGAVAIVDWNDPLNKKGAVSGEKFWGTYDSILRPEFTYDLMKTTSCADTTADGGGTQDLVDTYELTLNYAVAKQPTIAGQTPIFKYGVL